MGRSMRGRRLILAGAAAYAAGLLLLAMALHEASPGPATRAITGVGIGHAGGEGGIAYLSGRRLTCAPTARAPYTARCTVTIAGEELEILAARAPADHPNQFGGVCQARHAGRDWPCRIASRHVHVHWFAYLDEPLGLTPNDLAGLRWRHPFENAPERVYLIGLILVPVLTALLVMVGAGWWFAAGRRVWAAAAASLCGLAALVGTFALTLHVTGTFWD